MHIVLAILALLGGTLGIFSLTTATFGVGLLAGACLLAVVARMIQAHHHHVESRRHLERL